MPQLHFAIAYCAPDGDPCGAVAPVEFFRAADGRVVVHTHESAAQALVRAGAGWGGGTGCVCGCGVWLRVFICLGGGGEGACLCVAACVSVRARADGGGAHAWCTHARGGGTTQLDSVSAGHGDEFDLRLATMDAEQWATFQSSLPVLVCPCVPPRSSCFRLVCV